MKKLKYPKPKKISKTAWKRRCDKLFSLLIRALGYCQAEGKDKVRCGGVLQCAHIDTRSKLALRWKYNNVLCLCSGHHRYYSTRPLDWIEFIQEYYPEKWGWVMKHKNDIAISINYPALYKQLEDVTKHIVRTI